MIRHFLFWLSGYLPGRVIDDGDQPYLERYYVATVRGVRIYLHRFVGSDPDRGVHDHPWRWAFSLVLAGWYLEERREGFRSVRWINWLTGDTFHRVILPTDGTREVWTLFIHRAGDVKPWGFLRPMVDYEGIFAFFPFVYPGGRKDPCWWRSAPRGRSLNRRPIA